jgi:very-short-patch-repair endonuclease
MYRLLPGLFPIAMPLPANDAVLKAELERMRARLLDMSARNPLLNYSHPRASSLRIIDEIPTLVLNSLLTNGGFRFAPLESDTASTPADNRHRRWGSPAEPALFDEDKGAVDTELTSLSDRERREARKAASARREVEIRTLAQQLGLNASYDLAATATSTAPKHGDRRLQTLLTPDELETRLQKMQAAAVTAIQESGANMLHFLFGFVEWTDVDGDKPRMAPIVLLPVSLTRLELDHATHTFPYTVAASGEDWNTNVTLQEKCRRDFGFVFPSIEPEEHLESYFERVDEVLSTATRGWRLRRQLTLGLVSFGKILMWRDLDPTNWPELHPLLGNSLLRSVLGDDGDLTAGGKEDEGAEFRLEDYNIDRLPPDIGSVPPIVVPADSSQHSVLIDVQHGTNLVVQGPPGTGKSQTITNIIADAIAARKRILFIAEKKAALDVVARRLVDAGLGPFCLPLHSHTSNKREFLDGLAERIAIRRLGDSSAELESTEVLLHETRESLTKHVEHLHAPFGSLGDTAFSILWRARRIASELPEKALGAVRGITIANAASVTPTDVARQRALLTAFAAAHRAAVADISPDDGHPWDGLTQTEISFDGAQSLVALARECQAATAAAEETRSDLGAVSGPSDWPSSVEALSAVLVRTAGLNPPDPSVPPELIGAIHQRAGISSVREGIAAVDAARRAWARVPGAWAVPGVLTPPEAMAFELILESAAVTFGTSSNAAIIDAAQSLFSRALAHLNATEPLVLRVANEIGLDTPLPVGLSLTLIDTARAVDALPEGALELRSKAFRERGASGRLASLSTRADELADATAALDAQFLPEMRPNAAELREIAGALASAPGFLPALFSGTYRRAVSAYRRMSGGRRADRETMTADVQALLKHNAALTTLLADPTLQQLFGDAHAGVSSPFADATALLAWTRQSESDLRGSGEVSRAVLDAVWNTSARAWNEAAAVVSSNRIGVEAAAALRASVTDACATTINGLDGWESLSFSELRERLTDWQTQAQETSDVMRASELPAQATVKEGRQALAAVDAAWEASHAVGAHEATFHELGIMAPATASRYSEIDGLQAVRLAVDYLAQFHEPGIPRDTVDWLASGNPAERLSLLRTHLAKLASRVSTVTASEKRFVEVGGVDLTAWYGSVPEKATLSQCAARFERAVTGAGTLGRYVTRARARAGVVASTLPLASTLLETGAVDGDQLPQVYDYVLARTLAELVMRAYPDLDQFSGDVQETRRAQFNALDEHFIELTRKFIAERANNTPRIAGNRYGQVRDLTEQGLIEREIEKTRRHVPIREMFRRAGAAIQALKPCFMMGPQAVAQYLPPGRFHFDLIVMDEASQMRPEDALGAIARGSQLVVVGDPRQLGPTSFFDTHSEDEDDVEEAAAALAVQAAEATQTDSVALGASVLQRSESILQAAASRFPLRMLRWHYRSKYPELIAFSNQEFYGGDLILFPNPGKGTPGDGINFRAVSEGMYASSLNHKEASDVVAAVRKHAAESPQRTLLVVAMNQPQRELIDTLIQSAEKDDPTLAAFRARHEETLEPFGVKNLENVQGDERDVIYVSVTYGPGPTGTVAQNFGPVNTTGGERRLNVLFTRAKYRLDVFCSFDPTTLRVTESSPRGLVVLRDYLRYANEGTLEGGRFTGRDPDSDFEIEVARALRARGYDVHAQVGVAGYFLDLAVVDPDRSGRYILAVECDGATYHSAKSARDRDRLRQGVLEGLGWTVHRVWSTDWFRDPRGETAKIVQRLEGTLAQNRGVLVE